MQRNSATADIVPQGGSYYACMMVGPSTAGRQAHMHTLIAQNILLLLHQSCGSHSRFSLHVEYPSTRACSAARRIIAMALDGWCPGMAASHRLSSVHGGMRASLWCRCTHSLEVLQPRRGGGAAMLCVSIRPQTRLPSSYCRYVSYLFYLTI